MRSIYIVPKKEDKRLFERVIVDKLPAKSTFKDANKTNVKVPDSFNLPDEKAMQALFDKATQHFSNNKKIDELQNEKIDSNNLSF